MADEIVVSAPTPAVESVVTEAAPSSPTPEITPVVAPEPAPTPPPVESVPEVKPADVAPVKEVAPAEEPALLSPEQPEENKPSEEKEGEQKADDSPSDEPAPLPTYEAFTFPEGVTLDNDRLSEFTTMLGEFENSPKTHEEVQKFGQSLVDRHIAEVQTALERQRDALINDWNDRKKTWVDQFEADPEIGGNRKETSLREAKEFIKTHGGSPEHIGAFYKALQETGADSHPDVVRFLLNVKNSSTFRAPQQLPAAKPVPQVQSKIAKRYGGNV